MMTVRQFPALFALGVDDPMWNVVFVQEVVDEMSVAIILNGQHAKSGELTIAKQPASSHDQCIDDRIAHARYLGQCATYLVRRHVQDFRFIRSYTGSAEYRRSLQHTDVGQKIAR